MHKNAEIKTFTEHPASEKDCPYDPQADDPTFENPNNNDQTCHWFYTGDGKKPQVRI